MKRICSLLGKYINVDEKGILNIWRLIAHHEKATEAVELMTKRNRIAIGWPESGNLHSLNPETQSDIRHSILSTNAELPNATSGGASLWRFYKRLQMGDHVIVNANGRRISVFEIAGPYQFVEQEAHIFSYRHQREAILTDINAEKLWHKVGASVLPGENIRWTLVACSVTRGAESEILLEGKKYSVTSSRIERNPKARLKCLEYYGYRCAVCDFDFEETFGGIGKGFIHVHHREDLALKTIEDTIDPIKDLIPLCPNCHAMAHRRVPAFSVEVLRELISRNHKPQ